MTGVVVVRCNRKNNSEMVQKLNDTIIPLIIIEMADSINTLGPASSSSEREAHLVWSKNMVREYYDEIRTKLHRKNIVSGNDLISLGMKPAPELGKMLSKIREAQDTGLIQDADDGVAMATTRAIGKARASSDRILNFIGNVSFSEMPASPANRGTAIRRRNR